jgi:primase-polymerase (primpol)-like protein
MNLRTFFIITAFLFTSQFIYCQNFVYSDRNVVQEISWRIQLGRFEKIRQHHPFYHTGYPILLIKDNSTNTFVAFTQKVYKSRNELLLAKRTLRSKGYKDLFVVEQVVFRLEDTGQTIAEINEFNDEQGVVDDKTTLPDGYKDLEVSNVDITLKNVTIDTTTKLKTKRSVDTVLSPLVNRKKVDIREVFEVELDFLPEE